MPGLAGFTRAAVEPAAEPAASTTLGRMLELASAPDNLREAEFCDERVCAGRSHLGVLQPERQPVAARGVFVWFDGELYNAAELAATLPPTEKRESQVELFARLYRHRGLDFLPEVDGLFCAVVYDRRRRVVRLITDRLGHRYLHWTVSNGRLAWSSSIGSLTALPGFVPRLSPETVEQFLNLGYVPLIHTWFADVEQVRPGSVVTYHMDGGAVDQQRYWWWDRLRREEGDVDEGEAAEELGRLVRRSVERRSRGPGTVGVSLSGGLDSRALLAALPDDVPPVAITFGQHGCADIRVARQVAALKRASHWVLEMDPIGWLEPRYEGIWYGDGNLAITHMHGEEFRAAYGGLFTICLDGYAGDNLLRGDNLARSDLLDRFDRRYIEESFECPPELLDIDEFATLDRSDYYFMEQNSRRLFAGPYQYESRFVETRRPYVANDVVEFVYSLPDRLRFRGRLYYRMLLQEFPEYYRGIGWASTGMPISWPRGSGRLYRRYRWLERKLRGGVSVVGVPGRGPTSYIDYAAWMRREPIRGRIDALLRAGEAIYPQVTSRERVLGWWTAHLAGHDEHRRIGRAITLEVWLRRLLDHEQQGVQETPPPRADSAAARQSIL